MIKSIVLGGGCFWCTEAVFKRLKGVEKVESGYAGGTFENPSYQQVCTGETGHAEVVKITYDDCEISANDLLEVFFAVHDPTTVNQQGEDVGTQYRSVIFYQGEDQKAAAETIIRQLTAEKAFDAPIVTQLLPFTNFYPSEDYHHDFYAQNPQQPYCSVAIPPKLKKLEKLFKNRLK